MPKFYTERFMVIYVEPSRSEIATKKFAAGDEDAKLDCAPY